MIGPVIFPRNPRVKLRAALLGLDRHVENKRLPMICGGPAWRNYGRRLSSWRWPAA